MIALRVLVWLTAEPPRLERFLALTGISVDQLRARADDPALLAALLSHICAHEPDLIACAEALDTPPSALAAACAELNGDAF